MLIKAEYRDLLRSHPGITRLLTFDSQLSLLSTVRRLRTQHYDVALDLHCTPRSQLLLRGLRARRKLTYSKRVLRRALLVHLGWNTLRRMTPVPELYAAPLRRLGLAGKLGAPAMYLDSESVEAMQALVARSLPDSPDKPLLAVAPGARWPTKHWPVERFAVVARELAREKRAAVVILGGPDEAPLGPYAVSMARHASRQWGRHPVAYGQRLSAEQMPLAYQQRFRSHAHGYRPESSCCGYLWAHRPGVRLLSVSSPGRGRQSAFALPPVQYEGLAALSARASRLHAGHFPVPELLAVARAMWESNSS